MNKLGEYESAEEQGLLIRLPVKIGEPVFWVEWDHKTCTSKIKQAIAVEFIVDNEGRCTWPTFIIGLLLTKYGTLRSVNICKDGVIPDK